jgi:UPF0755 protein
MATYRGSGPPSGRWRPPGRANGSHPPMPPEPYGEPPMPPEGPANRFSPPGDTYHRGPQGPRRLNGGNNGSHANPPPFARNSGPLPPRPPGPFREPSNGANGWPSAANSANGRPLAAGSVNGWPAAAGSTNSGNAPPSAPPVRRNGKAFTPQSYIPKGYTEPQPFEPPTGPQPYRTRSTDNGHGVRPAFDDGRAARTLASDDRTSGPPANVHYPPSRPSRYAPEASKDQPPQPNRPRPPRIGNGAPQRADPPVNGRRPFTPIQDYLAGGADIITDRSRTDAPQSSGYAQDAHFNESRLNDSDLRESRLNGRVVLTNPLPLGDDYSARALAELAEALESSAERQHEIAAGGTESLKSDASGGNVRSWESDTITPERLESLLDRSDQDDEPLVADDTLMAKKPTSSRSKRATMELQRAAKPTRRSRRARHPLVVAGNAVFTLLVIIALLGGGAFVFGKQRFDTAGPLDSDKVVAIPRGLGTRDITDLLAKEGVIDQPWLFIVSAYIFKARGEDLKWGEYQFGRAASLHDVIATLVDGKVIQHKLTFAEGLTSEQIIQHVLDSDVLTGNIREIPREGSLLPQTYNVVRGTTREQLIQLMQRDQRRVVQEMWDHRAPDLPLKSPDQLVTLASIVEKETARPDERSRVAAVFINRLKQHMRLQSDPTIIYGLVGGKGSLGRPIMRSEIEQPTPYNTYVIDGLPPGPIANPGRASLEAAANPARTRELYFAADGTGGHAFAENLEQHQRNVAHLRQIEQQQVLAPWPGPSAPATTTANPPAPTATKPRPRSAATKPSSTN